MDVFAKDPRLKAALEDASICKRDYGAAMARKIQIRVAALRAARSLGDFWPPKSGPERCHELEGDLKGKFSIDVKQPYRLLFVPIEKDPPNDRSNEQQRWNSITSIEIVKIEDTHG